MGDCSSPHIKRGKMSKSKPHPWRALTPEKIEALDSPGRYSDGGCLSLVVRRAENGDHLLKYWVLRTMSQGRRVDMGLGPLKIVSLAKARVLAYKYRGLAKEGRNPILYRQMERKGIRRGERMEHREDFLNSLEKNNIFRLSLEQFAATLALPLEDVKSIAQIGYLAGMDEGMDLTERALEGQQEEN